MGVTYHFMTLDGCGWVPRLMGTTFTIAPLCCDVMSTVLNRCVPFTRGSNLMPRHPRLFIPGATYHVYCRVARGEFVFDDDHESIEFVETVREVRDLDSSQGCHTSH